MNTNKNRVRSCAELLESMLDVESDMVNLDGDYQEIAFSDLARDAGYSESEIALAWIIVNDQAGAA